MGQQLTRERRRRQKERLRHQRREATGAGEGKASDGEEQEDEDDDGSADSSADSDDALNDTTRATKRMLEIQKEFRKQRKPRMRDWDITRLLLHYYDLYYKQVLLHSIYIQSLLVYVHICIYILSVLQHLLILTELRENNYKTKLSSDNT